jgi:hypothetical protein
MTAVEDCGLDRNSQTRGERQMIVIIHGADTENRDDLAGRTVAEVRAMYQLPFNIAPDAIPKVNGQQVGEDYLLKDGDKVEFTKKAVKARRIAESYMLDGSTPAAGYGRHPSILRMAGTP